MSIGSLSLQIADRVPVALAVAAGVLGIMPVVSDSGWPSLFMAAMIVGEVTVLPVRCIALLPAWLLVTDRPEMLIEPAQATTDAAARR